MKDYLIQLITENGRLRGSVCVTTKLVDAICRTHGTSQTASAALGRALTGGALMGAQLDAGQRVALKFEGSGPLKKILVEADSSGNVRGFVGVPAVELAPKNGKPDVAGAIGRAGFLTVTKDLQLKAPYKGVVQLYTSEIAEDLAYYLTQSEQIPSAVGLGVAVASDGTVAAAGGFLLEAMPPADEQMIDTLIDHIQTLPALTDFFLNGKTPELLVKAIFQDIPCRIVAKHPLRFACACSKERVKHALISLGRQEIEAIFNEQPTIEILCEYCRTPYIFEHAEGEALLQQIQ